MVISIRAKLRAAHFLTCFSVANHKVIDLLKAESIYGVLPFLQLLQLGYDFKSTASKIVARKAKVKN